VRTRRLHLPVVDTVPPATVSELYDDFDEPRCIWCDRPRSKHAAPVDLGDGTTMVPACETCHAIDSPVNQCRRCRACWDARVTNVSYRMH